MIFASFCNFFTKCVEGFPNDMPLNFRNKGPGLKPKDFANVWLQVDAPSKNRCFYLVIKESGMHLWNT